jgi:hypothetical protein
MNSQVSLLQDQVAKNQASVPLSESEVDRYNQILDQLVPNKEDYFSILYSLENLSNDTGFNITRYSLNLAQSEKNTITIGVEGNGDTDSFLKFLNDYPFKGGRLITSDRVDIQTNGKDSGATTTLTLHFYTSEIASNDTAVGKTLTQQDLDFIKTIASKTSFKVKQSNNQIVEYPVKDNPFKNQ